MPRSLIVLTFVPDAALRPQIAALAADGGAELAYLPELDPAARRAALGAAVAVVARHTKDFADGELPLIAAAKLLQMTTAGVDYIPLAAVPAGVPIASTRGAFGPSIAEHVAAMALAAAKRLLVEHEELRHGRFNQFTRNRMLRGGVAGIFGFGGIGRAAAATLGALGMRIHALNRSGRTAEPVDWIGGASELDPLLRASDVLVIAVPLTRATERAIGARELGCMKEDAILVNIARGEIVDEAALYRHLLGSPRFTACIDAWWTEPIRHGAFRLAHPFLDLPNVVGSPHNSAIVPGQNVEIMRAAIGNCLRVVAGKAPERLVPDDERLL